MNDSATLRVFHVCAEFAPLAQTGGLADVSAALSKFLHRNGHDVRVLLPFYESLNTAGLEIEPVSELADMAIEMNGVHLACSVKSARLPESGLRVYLLDCPSLYAGHGLYGGGNEHLKFAVLSRAALETCQRLAFAPQVLHCHDWHAALVPLYLRTHYSWDDLFSEARSVLTIHNVGYQGVFDFSVVNDIGFGASAHLFDSSDRQAGRVSFLKTGVSYADQLTTVSPTNVGEILTPEYGMGLESALQRRRDALHGILNGIDYGLWDPQTDPHLPHHFSAADLTGKKQNKLALIEETGLDIAVDVPLVGLVSRLAEQKGIDLIQAVVPAMLTYRDFGFVVLGTGEDRYESFFVELANKFPGRVHYRQEFDNGLAHRIEAASDLFVMPSRYEPCGLNQMFSLRYGTVPVVRKTGGLADSVEHYDPDTGTGTGVVFEDYTVDGLTWALETALELYAEPKHWSRMVANGMSRDFSWEHQAAEYVELYESLLR